MPLALALCSLALAAAGAPAFPASQPSLAPADKTALLQMREEEKLAFDLYTALGEKWSLRPFQNIPRAEQMHLDTVKRLLDQFGLKDPNEGLGRGKFLTPAVQRLHDRLLRQGLRSEVEALRAGAAVEDRDIADLRRFRKAARQPDVVAALEFLEFGSRNHLSAFVRNLSRYGAEYKPRHLSQDEFREIVDF